MVSGAFPEIGVSAVVIVVVIVVIHKDRGVGTASLRWQGKRRLLLC